MVSVNEYGDLKNRIKSKAKAYAFSSESFLVLYYGYTECLKGGSYGYKEETN